jgi:hypothetical protein
MKFITSFSRHYLAKYAWRLAGYQAVCLAS